MCMCICIYMYVAHELIEKYVCKNTYMYICMPIYNMYIYIFCIVVPPRTVMGQLLSARNYLILDELEEMEDGLLTQLPRFP